MRGHQGPDVAGCVRGVLDEATKTLAYLATIGTDSRMATKQTRQEFEQIAHDGEQNFQEYSNRFSAIYTCQVSADFRFKVFSGILYKLGALNEETKRTVAWPNHFRRKGHVGVNMSVIPCFDTPGVEGDIYLFW